MKRLLLLAAIGCTMATQAQIKMPAPSPTQTFTQEFGLGKIELSYSRPSIKGRAMFKENSELAPLGSVWRTGANSATTVKFTDDVTIGGVNLKAGKYGLLSIPGKNEWIQGTYELPICSISDTTMAITSQQLQFILQGVKLAKIEYRKRYQKTAPGY